MSATIEAIKEMADLRALVEETVELRRQGSRWFGKCPFHGEDTASLCVDERKGLWKCFGGGCGKGGDIFSWVCEQEKCDFPEAVRYLCHRYNISVPEWSPEQQAAAEKKRKVGQLLAAIVARTTAAYPGSPGAEYMRARGITDEVAAAWGVGWAESPAILQGLLEEFGEELWEASGVAPRSSSRIKSSTPGMFDHRIIVPLYRGGRVLNLYGRSVKQRTDYQTEEAWNADKHRYLSGQVKLPFGLDEAGVDTVLVEGPIDAMSVAVAGYRAVSVGGAPSDEQRDLILRWTEGPVLLGFDADEDAGKGPLMALKMAAMLAKGPNGRIARIVDWGPGGAKDANAVLQKHGPDALRQLIQHPIPVLQYRRDKQLETKFPMSLLVQDGSTLKMEVSGGRMYVVETIDNRSDPKGIRAGVRLLRGNDTLNVDNISLISSITRRRFVNSALKNMMRMEPTLDKAVASMELESELLYLEQEVRYWDAEMQKRELEEEEGEKQVTPMTPQEREEAMAFLGNPYMLEEVVKDVHALGVVGEEDGALITWITMTSRLMSDPIYLCFKGESSVGKSFLLKTVSDLCPPDDVRAFTRITAQALFWAEDPATFLKHKFLIVSEKPGGEGADYSIRTMLSEKGLTMLATEKVEDRMVSKQRTVEGPMAYAETTTYLEIHAENETRLLEVYLDSTQEQTERIHERQRWEYTMAGRVHEADRQAIMRKHHNAQRLLRPLEVVIPFAEFLTFPAMKPRTRRDQRKFLNLVCCIAFAHQYRKEVRTFQRGGQAIEYVMADIEDYAVAYELARSIFAVSMDELDKRSRELFEIIVEMVTEKWYNRNDKQDQTLTGEEKEGPTPQDLMDVAFTRRELAQRAQWSGHMVNAALTNLTENELLRTPGGRPGQTFVYFIQYIPSSNIDSELERALISPTELMRLIAERQAGGGEGEAS